MSALEAFSMKKNALKNKLKIYESFFLFDEESN